MIIFDLETIPREDFSEKFLLYRSKNLTFRELKLGNLKDQAKINIKIAEVEEENRKLKKNFRNEDAKDVDYAQIICAAIQADNGVTKVVTTQNMSEGDLVEKLLSVLANDPGPIVGYNHSGYDIPLLKRVSLHYGIKVPPIFSRDNVVDIMYLFKENYSMQFKKLIEYAMIYGFDVEDDISSGHEILKRYQQNDWKWIKSHVIQDILMTNHLFQMFKACDLLPSSSIRNDLAKEIIEHKEVTVDG